MSLVLKNFIITFKKDLQKSLVKEERKKAAKYGRPSNGNSRLWGKIEAGLSPAENPTTVTIKMPKYWFWVDGGREPGKINEAGQLSIKDWVKRKGLNPSKIIDEMKAKSNEAKGLPPPKKKTPFAKAQKAVAYLAARKVRKKGYQGSNFYTSILKDGRLDKLRIDLLQEQKKEIIIEFNVSNNT